MKLIRAIKNTVRDGIIDECKIPDGVKRRLREMDPKEVVQELKSRSLNRIKISETLKKVKTSNSDVVKDIVKDICDDVAMLYVPYYDEYDEYARNDENWDGSDDKYEKIVEVVGQVLFGEYGDEVIRWLVMYFNNMVEEDFYDSYLPPFVKSKPQHKEQYDEQRSPEINKQTIKEQNKEDIINKLIDNDIDPTIIDDLLNSLTDEDINDLVLRNLERKLFKGGNKEKNVRDYFEKYISSLSDRAQQDPNDDFDVADEFLYGGLEPEQSKIGRKTFKKELIPLQVELLKLQEDVKKSGKPIVVVFEGRDSAGKGSTIKKMVEYLDPKYYNVIALGIATEEEREDWFGRYESKIESGKINFFDRSWYNRGIVEPVMGYSSQEDYEDFMSNVNEFEQSLIDKGVELIKFWLSITPQTQKNRFELRKSSPLKYWKFSPNDEKSIDKWEEYTEYKNKVLRQTKEAKPWTVVDTNDKRAGVLNAFRHLLNVVDYEGKDVKNIGSIYPEVVTTIKEKENIEGEIPEQWSPELAQDLEAFHNIKINEMINESKGISEPIRYVTRDITDIIKSETPGEYYLPEDTTETNEIEYDFKKDFQKFGISRSYNIPSFSIELLYKISDEKDMDVPYMINGALMSDGDTISILIIINPEEYPSLMYNLVADINDIVAHEIEHIFQQNNMRPEGEIYDDGEDKSQPKDKEYYKQPHELPAQLKGFKRVSKLRKQPIEKVIKDWFSRSKYAHQLSDEDSSEVISYLVNYYNNEFKPKMVKENKRPSDYLRRRVGHLVTDKIFNRLKSSCLNMLERVRRGYTSSKEEDAVTVVRFAIDDQSYKWYENHLGFDDEDDKLFDEIYSLMWNTYSKDLIEYVKSVMDYVNEDNPETIKESELPPSVRRRVNISSDFNDDILDDIKVGSLRMLMLKVSEFDQIINKGFKWAAEEMVPYDEDYDEDYDEYIKEVVLLLKDKYEDDVIEYMTRVIGTFNGPDTHKYTFKKHSERHGGSGFSETFNTWDDLILRFGYWMALEWDEIKRKLDDKNEGQILISSPGEPTNTMNYYFSIQKKLKNPE